MKWPVRTSTADKPTTVSNQSFLQNKLRLVDRALTLVVVLEQQWPVARVERRGRGLGLDGVVLLALLGHSVLAHRVWGVCFVFYKGIVRREEIEPDN